MSPPEIPDISLPSPLIRFTPDWPGAREVTLWVKRDDHIHPVISGNKWRKLSGALAELPAGCNGIISFGGGFSNHLHALGYACSELSVPFVAIVRGDYSHQPTPMLNDIRRWGATIHYVNKLTYHQRDCPTYLASLQAQFDGFQIIPEGGSQSQALKGVGQIVKEIHTPFDVIVSPVASGATLAGLARALSPGQHALGIAVLKGQEYLNTLVSRFTGPHPDNWHIEHGFHHGGYAKASAELRTFCDTLYNTYQIPVEPVYSGKMFFAVKALLASGHFTPGSRIVLLHTGGLQGGRNR